MLADWLSADGCRARAKMGDPVSDLDDIIYQVSRTEGDQALAQERDRARAWLYEQHGRVAIDQHNFEKGGCEVVVGYTPDGWRAYEADNIDLALIAAVLTSRAPELSDGREP